MTTFSKLNLPATYRLSTPVSTSFQIENSTFGILAVPLRQVDIQRDLTEVSKFDLVAGGEASAEDREFVLSPEASSLLHRGMLDAREGRVTVVPPELYREPSE